jgi:hypothetical protein
MSEKPDYAEFEGRADKPGGKIKETRQRDNIHQVSLQTEEGTTLIGVPVTVGAVGAIPKILLAPVRAAICATAAAAKIAGLKIVVEGEKE